MKEYTNLLEKYKGRMVLDRQTGEEKTFKEVPDSMIDNSNEKYFYLGSYNTVIEIDKKEYEEAIKEGSEDVHVFEKEDVRELAKDWQRDFSNNDYSYNEISNELEFLENLGVYFDLVEEFKENGIL